MLAVGVIILVEGVEGSDIGEYLVDSRLPKGLNSGCHHNPTARAVTAECIVEGGNLFGGGVLGGHGLCPPAGVVSGVEKLRDSD